MYPNLDYYCNTVTTYSDLVLPTIGCVTKIMRTWTLSEWWCGQDLWQRGARRTQGVVRRPCIARQWRR